MVYLAYGISLKPISMFMQKEKPGDRTICVNSKIFHIEELNRLR